METFFTIVLLGAAVVAGTVIVALFVELAQCLRLWPRLVQFIQEFRMHSRHSRIWAVTLVLIVSIIWGTGFATKYLVPKLPEPPKVEREKTLHDTVFYCASQGSSVRDSAFCAQIVDLVRQQGIEARLAKLEAK